MDSTHKNGVTIGKTGEGSLSHYHGEVRQRIVPCFTLFYLTSTNVNGTPDSGLSGIHNFPSNAAYIIV